ncbi:MAG: transglycosylase domain-containing protein [Stackebrandtia sp.]
MSSTPLSADEPAPCAKSANSPSDDSNDEDHRPSDDADGDGEEEKPRRRGTRIQRLVKRRRRLRRMRRRRVVALGVTVALLLGIAGTAASIFFAGVELPEGLDDHLSQRSTVYYSDGETEMGTLGTHNRTSVSLDEIPDHLEWALLAAEDAKFYDHAGVDFRGVMRALWNNVSGGDQQGASTLTQQYVGQVADIRDDGSYLRKAREAVMAWKMDNNYSKDQILNHYLNLVYLGRGAYGVAAGAEAFFGKPVAELDVAESALLVAQIKSPNGDYDPEDPLDLGSKARENAEGRWGYVLDRMVAVGRLSESKRAELKSLPQTISSSELDNGADSPLGFISHRYVLQELNDAGIEPEEVMRGGFDIVTTIDPQLQTAAYGEVSEEAVEKLGENSDDVGVGFVAVEPHSGRVLAYYGGEDGVGLDAAGPDSMHPPETLFGVVPAAASLEQGATPDDAWDGGSPMETYAAQGWGDESDEVGTLVNFDAVDEESVTMTEALQRKLTTPIYGMGYAAGPEAVAETAEGLGFERFGDPRRVDDEGVVPVVEMPTRPSMFDEMLAVGKYPVSVQDAAEAYGALANRGERVPTRFVDSVLESDGDVRHGADPESVRAIEPYVADEITSMLYGAKTPTGDPAAAATLGWPFASNASATWHAAYTSQIAVTVWAGDDTSDGDGSPPYGTLAESMSTSFLSYVVDKHPDLLGDGGRASVDGEEPASEATD